jgi:hypothetical protein
MAIALSASVAGKHLPAGATGEFEEVAPVVQPQQLVQIRF